MDESHPVLGVLHLLQRHVVVDPVKLLPGQDMGPQGGHVGLFLDVPADQGVCVPGFVVGRQGA